MLKLYRQYMVHQKLCLENTEDHTLQTTIRTSQSTPHDVHSLFTGIGWSKLGEFVSLGQVRRGKVVVGETTNRERLLTEEKSPM